MNRIAAALVAATVVAGAISGCGGGDSAADDQAIRDLVIQINRASTERDAKAACAVIAPSSLKEKFQTRERCVRETGEILKQAGAQPAVEVESIETDGDRAKVTFKDRNGEIELVRENGSWYVPITSEQQVSAGEGESGGSEE